MSTAKSIPSLYERLGGSEAVLAAVGLFYEKVTADATVARFFDHLDMKGQVQKQVAFMSRAFGGPEEYAGRDLTAAHAGLVRDMGLSDVHFDAIAAHLQTTLQELGIDAGAIDEVMTIVGGTRDAVLGRG